MNRLFFALVPNDAERLAAEQAARAITIKHQPSGKPVPASNYHVTLIFLGYLSDAHQEAAILAARTVQLAPFSLAFDQAASFKNRDIPWWIGLRQQPGEAVELRDELHKALWGAGVPLPKRTAYQPHITMQRHEKALLAPTPIAGFVWKIDEFVLMRSHLQSAPYEVVARFALRDRPTESADQSQNTQLTLL